MPIGNIFKRKKTKEIEGKEKIKPISESKEEISTEIKKAKTIKPKEKRTNLAYRILKSPHITEKATALAKQNQYVFKIWPHANKIEVKNAIEAIYGVDVLSIKIINVHPKKRRLGRIEGLRKGYKKAIVKLKEGQKIELLPK